MRPHATRSLVIGLTCLTLTGVFATAPPAHATTTAVDCATQDLQAAITAATAGDTLQISGTCYGNFNVDRALTLEGVSGAILDGNGFGTTVKVSTSDNVHLVSLEITDGDVYDVNGTGIGGGIDQTGGGLLTLSHVTVTDNAAGLPEGNQGPPPHNGAGGGIAALGTLQIRHSSIVHNQALAGAGGDAFGGGIAAFGPLTLIDSTVSSNRADGSGHLSPTVSGGGVIAEDTTVITGSHIDDNQAVGVTNGALSTVQGGGIVFDPQSNASLSITNSSVDRNRVKAGAQGATATGGGLSTFGTQANSITATGSEFVGNEVRADASTGSSTAQGGSLFAQTSSGLTLKSSQVTNSLLEASSTSSSSSAEADGGGVFNHGPLTVTSSSISSGRVSLAADQAAQGIGGGIDETSGALSLTTSTVDGNKLLVHSDTSQSTAAGGGVNTTPGAKVVASTISRNSNSVDTDGASAAASGLGGGLLVTGSGNLVKNSTIAGNTVSATTDPSGSAGAVGGGIESTSGKPRLVNSTVARNSVNASGTAGFAAGGGLRVEDLPATATGTIIALNSLTAATGAGADCQGTVVSGGHDLIGTKKGCSFNSGTGDKLDVNPKLGLLANNGGHTRTLALLTGSPAIDAIPVADCAVKTDQRGVKRPQGPACDIGSFELKQH